MAFSVLQVRLLKQLYTGEELWVKGFDHYIGSTRIHCHTITSLLQRGLIHFVSRIYYEKGQRLDLTVEGMAVAEELM